MIARARIGVVIPARDVVGTVGAVVSTLPRFVDHVVVVDDGSTDGTAVEARRAGGRRVIGVGHRRSGGVGAAIATGYATCLRLGSDVVAVMAGDGQMDPADLRAVLAPVLKGVADYASGDRLARPESRRAIPWARRLAIPVLGALTRWASGHAGLRDAQCGFTASSRAAIEALLAQGFHSGYGVPNDILCRLGVIGARVATVPVRALYPPGIRSGIRPWHALVTVPWILARGALRRLIAKTLRRYLRAPADGSPGYRHAPAPPTRGPARWPGAAGTRVDTEQTPMPAGQAQTAGQSPPRSAPPGGAENPRRGQAQTTGQSPPPSAPPRGAQNPRRG